MLIAYQCSGDIEDTASWTLHKIVFGARFVSTHFIL